MKKQILSIIMAGCLLLSMTACSSDKGNMKPAFEQTTADASIETSSPQEYSKTDYVMSTVLSEKIYGTKDVTQDIKEELDKEGIFLAAQCCEHLNRAIILERAVAKEFGLEVVNVVPQPKAGGSFATADYKLFSEPVAVETVNADAGLDIGQTLIGMHLKAVAVPVRLSVKKIGDAVLTAARVRPKFIGGCRAQYDEKLM